MIKLIYTEPNWIGDRAREYPEDVAKVLLQSPLYEIATENAIEKSKMNKIVEIDGEFIVQLNEPLNPSPRLQQLLAPCKTCAEKRRRILEEQAVHQVAMEAYRKQKP